MALSIQTNVSSLMAQENMRVNGDFQSRTIQRLTSGFRINSAADDAAGLAVANKFRSDIAELSQGVRNANDGLSQLQVMDGGIANIGKMLDRMKTLATQAATSTFSGDPANLDAEYTNLLTEIGRQASNIGLNATAGGTAAKNIIANYGVYTGGGNSQANAQVTFTFDAAGAAVDTTNLGVNGTSLTGGDLVHVIGTSKDLRSGTLLTGDTASFAFTNIDGSATKTVVVSGGSAGISGSELLKNLNGQLNTLGISASLDSTGKLQFSSSGLTAFTVATDITGTTVASADEAATSAAASATFGTGNAKTALTAIDAATKQLGKVQANMGAAMNQLGYAIQLGQSQISNFSAAESRIRDADVAAEAANLTKAQVLQQASIAAMAQANSAPQAVLSLLRG